MEDTGAHIIKLALEVLTQPVKYHSTIQVAVADFAPGCWHSLLLSFQIHYAYSKLESESDADKHSCCIN